MLERQAELAALPLEGWGLSGEGVPEGPFFGVDGFWGGCHTVCTRHEGVAFFSCNGILVVMMMVEIANAKVVPANMFETDTR